MKTSKGFTLVELLITVTIISLLSVIGIVSYTAFIKNARDNRRDSDIKFIQSALEQYNADQKAYPVEITPGSPLSFGNRNYMTKVPTDPLGSNPNYLYVPKGSCSVTNPQNCLNYCLYVKLEGTPPVSNVGCEPSEHYNFGVTRP